MISKETRIKNYNRFRSIINDTFKGDRLMKLNKLYDDYEDRLKDAPASSFNYFHNAVQGGYCDHILRVIDFSKIMYKVWKATGMEVDNFTEDELIFTVLNHDLGKLGFPGDNLDGYVRNKSEWHVKNQGRIYESNDNNPYSTISDRTMYILQRYEIKCTWNEYQAIKIHDGVYDDANKPYYMGFSLQSKMKCNLPLIVHMADHMASRFEFERWAKEENTFSFKGINEWDINVQPTLDKFTDNKKNDLNIDDL